LNREVSDVVVVQFVYGKVSYRSEMLD